MLADITDFESLQSKSVAVSNELVYRDESIRLIRRPVHWRIDKDDAGRFKVVESEENAPEHWRGTFPSLEDAQYFIALCKTQLQQ